MLLEPRYLFRESSRLYFSWHVSIRALGSWAVVEWTRLAQARNLSMAKVNQPTPNTPSEEASEICSHVAVVDASLFIPLNRYSSFTHLIRMTSWILRFIHNSSVGSGGARSYSGALSASEVTSAEVLWLSTAQSQSFPDKIGSLRSEKAVSTASCLRASHPFLDLYELEDKYTKPSSHFLNDILSFYMDYTLTKLIICAEHIRLLHAGPTLVSSSQSRRFHIAGQHTAVRSITRSCVVCRWISAKPTPQLMEQLPKERITPGIVFENVGIDYASPVNLKLCRVHKPTIVKAYISLFVSMSVKAVHLELVNDLASAAFIACLRRFIAHHGKPASIWSDHGSNFMGASQELDELTNFFEQERSKTDIPDFCTSKGIQWNFIPERAPHFDGLWEFSVKSV